MERPPGSIADGLGSNFRRRKSAVPGQTTWRSKVADLEASICFYPRQNVRQSLEIGYVRLGSSVLELVGEARAPIQGFHFCVIADDFDAAVARLSQAGVRIVTPPLLGPVGSSSLSSHATTPSYIWSLSPQSGLTCDASAILIFVAAPNALALSMKPSSAS